MKKAHDRRLNDKPQPGEILMEEAYPDRIHRKPSPAELARLKALDERAPEDGWIKPKLQFTRRRLHEPFAPAFVGCIEGYGGVDLWRFTTIQFTPHKEGAPSFCLDIYGRCDGLTLVSIAKKRGFNLDAYSRQILRSET